MTAGLPAHMQPEALATATNLRGDLRGTCAVRLAAADLAGQVAGQVGLDRGESAPAWRRKSTGERRWRKYRLVADKGQRP